jgi:hypothetical protein
MFDQNADREAIIELIHRNRIAFWTRDFELWDSCAVRAPYMTRWGWWRGGGPYLRRGFAENSARLRTDYPPVDLDNAHNATIEDLSLQIGRDMAWATFVQHYPGRQFPGHVGPGRMHEMRIFERHNGEWKIALIGVLDNNASPIGAAVVQLDAAGTVLWTSPAAAGLLAGSDDLAIRNGVLHFRDRRHDRKLREALVWAVGVDHGYLVRHSARPIVVEAGEGLPTRIYWIAADADMILLSLGGEQLNADRLALAAAVYSLSPAQIRLAGLVAEGLALPEIAARMGITQEYGAHPSQPRFRQDRGTHPAGARPCPADRHRTGVGGAATAGREAGQAGFRRHQPQSASGGTPFGGRVSVTIPDDKCVA